MAFRRLSTSSLWHVFNARYSCASALSPNYRWRSPSNKLIAAASAERTRWDRKAVTFCTSSAPNPKTRDFNRTSDPETWVRSLGLSIPGHSSSVNPFHLVSADLDIMTRSIRDTVSVLQHPTLDRAASHLLSLNGKRIRPVIVLLMAYASATVSVPPPRPASLSPSPPIPPVDLCLGPALLPSQLRLAEITELIHAASLLHDDVIDIADTRRGTLSVNNVFGNQLAVLAGDFLLARASVALARLRDCNVVELLSTVIEHLVRGEVLQMNAGSRQTLHGGIGDACTVDKSVQDEWYHHPSGVFETYLAKTFFKSASLIANSCRAVAMLAGHAPHVIDAAYRYGEDVGMAFQLMDDVLDMTATEETLGKPVMNDVRQGVVTAPILFALEKFPDLRSVVDRRCSAQGDINHVVEFVERADGIGKTKQLARKHIQRAVEAIVDALPPSDYRSALINIADFAYQRKR